MAARFTIIDGYNLLHAAGMAQDDYAQGELQRCRTRLLRFLLDRMTFTEISRATVVFDARDPPIGFPSQFTVSGLRVIFANPGGDADVLIEQMIAEHTAPRQLRLVSGDRRLQAAAKKRRAAPCESEHFFEELNQRPPTRKEAKESGAAEPDIKAAGRLSDVETAHWLNVFGDVPGIDELAQASIEPLPAPVAKATPDKPVAPQPPVSQHEADISHWLQEFGEIPETKQLKGKPGISQADVNQWIAEFEKDEK